MTPLQKIQGASAGLAFILLATSAHADADGDALSRLAPAFGNTIVSTHPDGRKARLWLEADGSYTAEGRAGNRASGTWKLKGDKLCLREHRPFPTPFPYCKSIQAEDVGKPWRDKAVNGEPVTNEIVRGEMSPAR
jgi:hypothetical protein